MEDPKSFIVKLENKSILVKNMVKLIDSASSIGYGADLEDDELECFSFYEEIKEYSEIYWNIKNDYGTLKDMNVAIYQWCNSYYLYIEARSSGLYTILHDQYKNNERYNQEMEQGVTQGAIC